MSDDQPRLGKYDIIRTLGHGAMGVVHEGFDRIIERRVAIKTMRTIDLDPDEAEEQLRRFLIEARAAGKLNHPNIVSLYDHGEQDGTAYLVMELVVGRELQQWFDDGRRFTLDETVQLMGELLAALGYSHRHGVVHRDVKPANIFITESGSLKLGDFGIARIESANKTRAGLALGTPTHMAPEQIRGETADARSDLYAAGVVLLQLLTGSRPFAGTMLSFSTFSAIVAQIGSQHPQFEVLPFKPAHIGRSQYLLTGTMTRQPTAHKRAVFLLNLALTDLKTGNVVAQASAKARDQGIDTTPLPYYQDSPILLKDKVIDGYVRTTATAPGQPADRHYFERITIATLVSDATEAYNAGRYQEALGQYRAALATPAGEQLRVLNGIYLSSWKLGRNAEAEQAFGKVVALGIAHNQLGVKFLFNPNSTEFWSDSRISGAYAMWLRQIAREAVNAKVCMDVVGHTSHSGPEDLNDALSLRRASHVRQLLASEAPSLAPRMTPLGRGFRENIVGTGTDNAADALDRRVEFRIRAC